MDKLMLQAILRIILLLIFLPSIALAATNGNIKGVAVDDGGLPIPGVVVTVTSDNLMGERKAQSDANGQYLINESPPGHTSSLPSDLDL